MDKKTLKVIEKYSMPFVQLVIEKGGAMLRNALVMILEKPSE